MLRQKTKKCTSSVACATYRTTLSPRDDGVGLQPRGCRKLRGGGEEIAVVEKMRALLFWRDQGGGRGGIKRFVLQWLGVTHARDPLCSFVAL